LQMILQKDTLLSAIYRIQPHFIKITVIILLRQST